MVLKCVPQQASPIVLHLLKPRLCKGDTSWLLEASPVANDHSMRHAKSHGGKVVRVCARCVSVSGRGGAAPYSSRAQPSLLIYIGSTCKPAVLGWLAIVAMSECARMTRSVTAVANCECTTECTGSRRMVDKGKFRMPCSVRFYYNFQGCLGTA